MKRYFIEPATDVNSLGHRSYDLFDRRLGSGCRAAALASKIEDVEFAQRLVDLLNADEDNRKRKEA